MHSVGGGGGGIGPGGGKRGELHDVMAGVTAALSFIFGAFMMGSTSYLLTN